MARTTIKELLATARAGLARLTPAEAQAASIRGALLIDTRSADLLERDGTIPHAFHVPLSVLYWRLDPESGHEDQRLAKPDAELIVICDHGYSSSLAAATLRQLGFTRVTDMIGGFQGWRAQGLPVETVSASTR